MTFASNRVDSFVDRWANAELRADVTSLRAMLDGGFLAVAPDGGFFNKAAWLERYQSGDLVHDSFHWRTLAVALSRGCAFVVGALARASSYRGRDASGNFRMSLTIPITRRRARLAGLHEVNVAGRLHDRQQISDIDSLGGVTRPPPAPLPLGSRTIEAIEIPPDGWRPLLPRIALVSGVRVRLYPGAAIWQHP